MLEPDATVRRILELQNETINAQAENIDRLVAVVEGLPSRREARFTGALMIAVILVLVILSNALTLRTIHDGTEQRRILIECTTPSQVNDRHECYEDGQARTAEAVGLLDGRNAERIEGLRREVYALHGQTPPVGTTTVPPPRPRSAPAAQGQPSGRTASVPPVSMTSTTRPAPTTTTRLVPCLPVVCA